MGKIIEVEEMYVRALRESMAQQIVGICVNSFYSVLGNL